MARGPCCACCPTCHKDGLRSPILNNIPTVQASLRSAYGSRTVLSTRHTDCAEECKTVRRACQHHQAQAVKANNARRKSHSLRQTLCTKAHSCLTILPFMMSQCTLFTDRCSPRQTRTRYQEGMHAEIFSLPLGIRIGLLKLCLGNCRSKHL